MFGSPLPEWAERRRRDRSSAGYRRLTLRCSVWSSASLENVVALRQCKRTIEGRPQVIGLLLIYRDDSVRTVGQVRLDCLKERMEVNATERLWLDVRGFMNEEYHYVANIELSGPIERDPNWFEVTWHGTLD